MCLPLGATIGILKGVGIRFAGSALWVHHQPTITASTSYKKRSPPIQISNNFPLPHTEHFLQTKKEPTFRWANGLRIDKLLSIQLLAES